MKFTHFFMHIILLCFVFSLINPSFAQKKDNAQTYPNEVEPLIQNQWTTGTWPYNAYNPEDADGTNGHWVNACGPTSFARIMHYWQFPVNGKKVLNFRDTWGNYWNVDLTNMNLNYPDMKAVLYQYSTQAEYNETARLFEAACAVGEKITIGWTGDKERIPGALVDYFGFKSSLHWVDRWNYTKEEWIDILKNELANGRPVLMMGRTTDSPPPWESGHHKGHYWVLDGYNANNEFYCDYAFNDIRGYYDVDNLGEIYIAYNSALIGIEPDWGNKELQLVQPTVGGSFFNDEEFTITWNSSNIQNLKIELSDNKGQSWNTIAENVQADSGSYSFTPANIVSENCRVKISDQTNVNINRISDIFEIRNPLSKSISIMSPNGGEYFFAGKAYPIVWESELISNVDLDYSTDNGSTWKNIINNFDDASKKYDWIVPTVNSENCLIRITESGNKNISSQSPNTFIISEKQLIGGPYYKDENTVLLLHFDGDYKNMSDLSDDGTASGGGQEFITNSALKLDECLRFKSEGDKISIPHSNALSLSGDWTIELWAKFSDYGNFPFLIRKPGDGDPYQSNYSIQLHTSWGNVFHVFYFPVKDLRVNITAPSPELNKWYHIAFIKDTKNSQLKLIIHDENRNEVFSKTNSLNTTNVLLNSQDLIIGGDFTGYIDEVRISNVVRNFEEGNLPGPAYNPSPVNNASNVNLDNNELSWTNGLNTEKIDLYFGKTNPPQELALNNVDPQTSYQLNRLEKNTTYYWKIVSKNSFGSSSSSVWNFTTKDETAPTISLKTPNGGEYLLAGKIYPITWELNLVSFVDIDYSTDNGSTWNSIINNYDGSSKKYDWTVPEINSESCLIRISENGNSSVRTQSSNIFTISKIALICGPYSNDENTVLLLHFDGDYKNMSNLSGDGTASGGGQSFTANSALQLGECLKFSSEQDKIIIPHTDELSLSGDWTIELWAKFSDYGNFPFLIRKPGDGDPYQSNYSIQLHTSWGNVFHVFYFPVKDLRINAAAPAPELNKWYHIAFIRDTKKSELKMVIHDENRKQIFSSSNNFNTNNVLLNSQDLVIGGDFIGCIDEVRISNVVRAFDTSLPVELTSFTVNKNNSKLMLNWTTATEVNNHGFEIERMMKNDWIKIGFIKGQGNSTTKNIYKYEDDLSQSNFTGIVEYRLKQIDFDGSYSYSKILSINLDLSVHEYSLSQNYPNPFNPTTTIGYSVPSNSYVSLKVYDILGNKVADLVNKQQDAGNYKVNFDAANLASGLYIYKIQAGNFMQVRKMTLLK